MKNAIIASLLNKIIADAAGSGNGKAKIGKFKFREGDKTFSLEGLDLSWDFKETSFSFKEGRLAVKGNADMKLKLAKLSVTSIEHDGEFEMEEIELDKFDDIADLLVVMPIKELKRLADLRDSVNKG